MPDELSRVAGVRFRHAGKIFYFDTAGMRLEPGEYVVVETVRGPEIAKVVIAPGQVVVNELNLDELRPILRLATEHDIRRADELHTRAQDLLPEARRLAAGARFPARIDGAEFTLDGRRLTFSFTSEERLDYREFVRRAAETFHAKIDMRQMGARDRARAAGGYGICGRELCCSNWLASFPSISIRMAKEQELPLNPQKISGLCGRLLCCLSYEEEGYREMRRSLPRMGQRCSTPTGEGKVIGVNILRRQVTLLVEGQRVDVGDRDLGTIVRWDTSSKSAPPPPSLTRAEAIAMGLIAEGDEPEPEPPAPEDWITAGRAPAAPGNGRGRLPAPRPPRAARPPQEAPASAPPTADRPVPRREGRRRPGPGQPPRPAQGAAPGAPSPSGGPTRTFRRSGETGAAPRRPQPGSRPAQPSPPAPPAVDRPAADAASGDRARAARRRRRGGRGGDSRPPAPE